MIGRTGMNKVMYSVRMLATGLAASLSLIATGALAQVQTIDPNAAIDGDLAPQSGTPTPPSSAPVAAPAGAEAGMLPALPADAPPPPASTGTAPAATPPGAVAAAPQAGTGTTYKDDDLIGAAEGVFGKGAAGLADLIKDLLKKQGEPNAYIVGREGGGALVFGLRYGSGTMHHKVEGERPVYWTGPSIGFDAGANAASTFVLVYNLYDSEELYKRFPAGEGQAYLVGGFHVSYLRKGDTVLIPVRSGAGLRLGINGGYMKFSRKQNWFPF
jgi:hypothetical protein